MTRYTNEELRRMLETLEPLLHRRDLIGYAAAVNAHRIGDATAEYQRIRGELFMEYGTPHADGTPGYSITVGSPEHAAFERELEEVAAVGQDVEIMTVPLERACGELSGDELLATWWMFEDDNKEES